MTETIQRDLVPERQQRLCDIIQQRRAVRVDELVAELGVSAATIRRDLEVLEEQGRVRRVHGGAVSVENRLDEPLFDDKTGLAAGEKYVIAAAALELISAGDTIYLDGGSTVLELARLLKRRKDITVVTNSLRAAVELSGSGPQVILAGGELRRRSQTMVGSLGSNILKRLHVDKAFMGTIGLSLKEGTTTTDAAEAFTKEVVMERAETVVLLADSSKIGKVSFAQVGTLDDIDILITDAHVPGSFARQLRKQQKIDVIIAEEE
jgi:DeoR/GlpR family transcriptional regulator of sugar metabolism